ncbi:MAG: DUF2318 domain-containing protein [Oscillospiraceae bacterium]|nr:DUF2318 domain-containing protein [Oscillospiraceae bacterium]MBQ8835713.1 DUF2318 domain-containing protein [Oscillospiraceae bacterium]
MKKNMQIPILPILAAAVVVVAAAVTLLPKLSPDTAPQQSESAQIAENGDLVLQIEDIGTEASFIDYDADGTTVQLFAVLASDGTVRLALNTCQVCNGSPYAYFTQEGDWFICQNCKNKFASTHVGIVSGGCNPIPITDGVYTQQEGTIRIPASFLTESAALFQNWKNF